MESNRKLYNEFKELIEDHPGGDIYDCGFLSGIMAAIIRCDELNLNDRRYLFNSASNYQKRYFFGVNKYKGETKQ